MIKEKPQQVYRRRRQYMDKEKKEIAPVLSGGHQWRNYERVSGFYCFGCRICFVFYRKWKLKGKDILFLNTVMYVYLSFLLFFTLMPIVTSLPFIFNHSHAPVNLVPFVDVLSGRGDFVRQVVLNVIMTIPFGFLLPLRSVYKELHADRETAADNKRRMLPERAAYRLFCCPGFPKGCPLWHTTLLAKCSVLYLLAWLTGETGCGASCAPLLEFS